MNAKISQRSLRSLRLNIELINLVSDQFEGSMYR